MKKEDIESILMVNRYLTICKGDSDKQSVARTYLNHKIKKALSRKKSTSMPLTHYIKSIFVGL